MTHGEFGPPGVLDRVAVTKPGRIVKAPDLAACQDQSTNGVCIARSAFQAVPKMDRT
jgi:hypothetical protein